MDRNTPVCIEGGKAQADRPEKNMKKGREKSQEKENQGFWKNDSVKEKPWD